ncbi:MAG: radical SAM protein [Deltaproteobacteria bacterium]|jgi:MoaA/NifB/PqqE/SkfB family radical SAM enzyme|nr:radical SAM protein [Deltaproteobacteria bacterium]
MPVSPQAGSGPSEIAPRELSPSDTSLDEIGLEKILLFPSKISSLPQNLTGADPSYPVSVELSLTSRCDLSCIWCSDKTLRKLCPDSLDLKILKRLFKDLRQGGTKGVTIEGGGEPTISPLFEEAVEAALGAGLSVGLITNGCSLTGKGFPFGLLRLLQWVRVSLDACDSASYKLLKGEDRFEDVMEGLSRLAALSGGPVVGAGYVLTRLNDDPAALRALAEKLSKMGLSYLHLRPVVDHDNLASRRDLSSLGGLDTASFRLNLGALADNKTGGNEGLPCLAHSLSSVITADGRVWLCGRLCVDPSAGAVGSLLEKDFKSVWLGPERLSEAKKAASGDWCRLRCPQCRMTKYNRLLEKLGRLRTRDFI